MKKGWEYKRIKDIGSVVAGTTPNTNIAEYWDGNLCWISPAELDGSHYLYDSKKKITEVAVKAKSFKLLPEGTVILSSRAPIGKVVINKIPTYCNQGFKCVVCGKDVYNEFLYWWFWGKKEYLNSLGTGATFKEISKKVVEEIIIPVPPLSEQQSIVDYLDSAFAKIDAMKANVEKALNEAKALFQASLKEMLEPREGWEEKTLKEIVHPDCSLSYGIVQPGEHVEDGVPVVRPVDFNDRVIVRAEGLKRTKREISDAYKRTILKGGEILLCVRGTTGTMGLASDELKGCNVTRGIVPIFFEDNVDKMFVYYQLLSPKLQKEIQKKTTGAALKQINIKDLRAMHLMFPPLSEQQAIVATLDSLKSKVDRLQANYEKISQECDALKQAILRQVFE